MMKKHKNIRVILSGGGTGGHVFPAIAIANAIREKQPDAEILFVGAMGRMEMEKVPAAGYEIQGLPISGWQRKLTAENLKFPFKLIASSLKAYRIVKNFKPDLAIGTGGYASGPVLRIASWLKIPTLIQEQNSYPGITNKMLANKVNAICVAYSDMGKYFPVEKMHLLGNPVRSQIEKTNVSKTEACKHFGLDENKITLLVLGGSLGARTINQSIDKALDSLINQNIQVIWQTGKTYSETAQARLNALNAQGLLTMPFINEMDKAYTAADIVVSRAGAIAISELCLMAKPAILVPSPNVAEDHQTKNALALANNNAAIMVKDIDAIQTLGGEITNLAQNAEKQNLLGVNIKKQGFQNAAANIALIALSLILKNKKTE